MAEAIRVPFMNQLVDSATNTVRFATLLETHNFLLSKGLILFQNGPYKVGRQLYYTGDDLLIRIKTHGEPAGHRAGQAHMSVALVPSGILSEYKEEWVKFDAHGEGRGKPNVPASDPLFDLWAKATHFNFPNQQLLGAEVLPDVFGSNPTAH